MSSRLTQSHKSKASQGSDDVSMESIAKRRENESQVGLQGKESCENINDILESLTKDGEPSNCTKCIKMPWTHSVHDFPDFDAFNNSILSDDDDVPNSQAKSTKEQTSQGMRNVVKEPESLYFDLFSTKVLDDKQLAKNGVLIKEPSCVERGKDTEAPDPADFDVFNNSVASDNAVVPAGDGQADKNVLLTFL